jgi:CheY-like chemotaxis protein
MATILLIDDNEVSSALRVKVLALHGHCAQIALNGRTGLVLAEAMKPDLIILDHMLPDMTGDEVNGKLKALLPDTPVVSLSALSVLPDGYVPEPAACLVKGDSVQELIRTIGSLLK